jgi:hypothetical protein
LIIDRAVKEDEKEDEVLTGIAIDNPHIYINIYV